MIVETITEGPIKVGCNGQSALRAFDLDYYFNPQQADFDILSSLHFRIQNSPITWTPRHILGHQDRLNPSHINHWAALNIKLDLMAKAYWQEIDQAHDSPE
jgi:hypothetical protein